MFLAFTAADLSFTAADLSRTLHAHDDDLLQPVTQLAFALDSDTLLFGDEFSQSLMKLAFFAACR